MRNPEDRESDLSFIHALYKVDQISQNGQFLQWTTVSVHQGCISSEFMDTAIVITDFLVHERFDKMGFHLQVEVWLCFKRCWSLREPYLRSSRFSFQPLKRILNIWVTLKNIANQDISNKKKKKFKCFILKLQKDFLSLNTYKSFFFKQNIQTT